MINNNLYNTIPYIDNHIEDQYMQIVSNLLKTIFIVIMLQSTESYAEDSVAGHWEGHIEISNHRPIAVKVDLAINGTDWSGTINIPTQSGKDFPLSDILVEKNDGNVSVSFSIHGVQGNPTFDGQLQGGVISGTFSQYEKSIKFHLSREFVTNLVRPQEPKPPFPYQIEEVIFQSDFVNLAGTLTIPSGKGPFPAVLLISGSGLQDRDQTVYGHKPFWVLADYLTRAGVAVLRVDDAGFGKSTPHPSPPTTMDLATDAEAGVLYLKQDQRISSVGLIGHSEGGMIAAIVSSRRDDISFVVLLAGPGVPGTELLLKQNERIFAIEGIPDEHKQVLLNLLNQLFTILTSDMTEDEHRQKVIEIITEIVRKEIEVKGGSVSQEDEKQIIQERVEESLTPWMYYFLAFDPGPVLEAIQAPVLALNGDLDVQVDAEQNLTAIAKALEKGGNRNVTIHRLPKHNHLFQHANTGLVSEYDVIEETISPKVLNLIRDWVLSVTQ